MLQIALCDDDGKVIDELYEIIEEFFSEREENHQITIYQDGSELVSQKINFDIIFLDIEMPVLNGIKTAREIRTYDKRVKIVYITNYMDYWRYGYEIHAFNFLEKPFQKEKIMAVLAEWMQIVEDSKQQVLMFETSNGSVILSVDEIYYFMVTEKKTILISTTRGQYVIKDNLIHIYESLNKKMFFITHRSFIVNLKYIREINKDDILLTNNDTVSLSQRRKQEFLKCLYEYVRSREGKV